MPTIIIRLNGQSRSVPGGNSVTALIAELGFAGQPVLVELNGAAIFPRDFDNTVLRDADAVEVIRIVAGG